MGIGMVIVCAAEDEKAVRAAIAEPIHTVGRLVSGPRNVQLV
jgi:phosphoribosylaminoimidazole (AIR) synthetase